MLLKEEQQEGLDFISGQVRSGQVRSGRRSKVNKDSVFVGDIKVPGSAVILLLTLDQHLEELFIDNYRHLPAGYWGL